MSYFQGIQDTVESQATIKDIDFLQLDMALVAGGVARQAQVWKGDYGEVLLTTSRALLTRLQDRIDTFNQQLNTETTSLESLKYVLNTISEVNSVSQDVELEMLDIVERYRTVLRYRIGEVPLGVYIGIHACMYE